jgi:histidyl-tRNA synthetase
MSQQKTYQSARGVRDILPSDQKYWQYFRRVSEKVLESLGIDRIDLPHFENAEIFDRGIGSSTDIVQKELFYLENRDESDNSRYALRPEFTAGAVRSYIQNGMGSWPQPVKLYYIGAAFRRERPQKGRFREFYQLGMEIFGDDSAKSDYLCIMSAWEILKKIGLKNIIIYANSIGCPKCRPKYISKLKKFYKDKLNNLCPDCLVRYEKNTLRILDCKEEKCQKISNSAPVFLDALCVDCKNHFQSTLEYLDYFNIRYDLDPKLVRGLDYYSKTVFEICQGSDKSRQGSLGGGGRYDGLVEILGGQKTPAVGYSLGIDRIVSAMKEQNIPISENRGVEVSILQLGEKAKNASKKVYDLLSNEDINVFFVPSNDTLRSQIRQSVKAGAKFAVIIGQKEALKEEIILRDLKASAQELIPLEGVGEEIIKRLI